VLVKEDPAMAKVYGVKWSSLLNQSKFFHLVDGLDLDIMHEQLEGELNGTVCKFHSWPSPLLVNH
jgi:hypothetical protein